MSEKHLYTGGMSKKLLDYKISNDYLLYLVGLTVFKNPHIGFDYLFVLIKESGYAYENLKKKDFINLLVKIFI